MKFFFVLSVMMVLISLMTHAAALCICTADYKPVCGVNGRTYSNKCRLSCDNVKMAHPGKC